MSVNRHLSIEADRRIRRLMLHDAMLALCLIGCAIVAKLALTACLFWIIEFISSGRLEDGIRALR